MANNIAEMKVLQSQVQEKMLTIDKQMEEETCEETLKSLATERSTQQKLHDHYQNQIEIEEDSARKFKTLVMSGNKPTLVNGENYLSSTKAMDDFAIVLKNNAGKTLADVHDSWKHELATKGITNPEVLFPKPVVQAISDAFDASGRIFGTFKRIFGVYAWSSAINTSLDGALGFTPSTTTTPKLKKEQNITPVVREITAQEIYKYIKIPRRYLKETQSTRAILNYVLSELPMHVVRRIEKTAIIGSPELTGDDAITSIIPIATDVAPYKTADVASTGNAYIDLMTALSQIKAGGMKYVVTSTAYLTQMRLLTDSNGAFLFPPGTDFKVALGVEDIFTPDWFPTGDDAEYLAVAYAGDAYYYVGDGVTDNFRNFIMQQNSEEFLSEIMGGSALLVQNSAAVVTPAAP